MTEPTIDELLTRSAPSSRISEPGIQVQLHNVVAQSRESARSKLRRTRFRWALAPVIVAPAIALATTAGTEARMVPDFTIPVTYTTDTGRTLSCSIDLFNGELGYVEVSTAAVDHLRAQDWTGIGQRIYDTALDYEAAGDWAPWSSAETELVQATVPEHLLTAATGGLGSDSDCTGELH